MGVFGASRVARRRRARVGGRSLAALGSAVSVAAARLGGNLVYEQKIGVDHSDPEKLPDKFTPVLSESNLPDGKPVRVDSNGSRILLVRHGSQIYALGETSSHLGCPLSQGTAKLKCENPIVGSPMKLKRPLARSRPSLGPRRNSGLSSKDCPKLSPGGNLVEPTLWQATDSVGNWEPEEISGC
mgnify:CR=1 FL=1